MNKIIITAGNVSLPAELTDSPTAQKIWDVLPIEGQTNIWGDEIYFSIPIEAAGCPRRGGSGRVGLLAAGKCLLYFLRANAGQFRRQTSRGQPGEYFRKCIR